MSESQDNIHDNANHSKTSLLDLYEYQAALNFKKLKAPRAIASTAVLKVG